MCLLLNGRQAGRGSFAPGGRGPAGLSHHHVSQGSDGPGMHSHSVSAYLANELEMIWDHPGSDFAGLDGALVAPPCMLIPSLPWLWGQVLVLELSDTPSEKTVSVSSVDLLQDREGFTWKGHERLSPCTGPLPWPAGFQPRVLVQCLPPAAVTAVTLHAEWSLVAFGTSHGFGLFDYQRKTPVLARCVGWPGPQGGGSPFRLWRSLELSGVTIKPCPFGSLALC